MGYRLRFTETIGDMLDYGPALQLRARCGHCNTWHEVNLIEWAAAYGAEFSFWDWIEPCGTCGRPLTFLSSPGSTTPLLPMWTEEGRELAFAINDRVWREEMALKRKKPHPR